MGRDNHAPDNILLISVLALTAIGVLMDYLADGPGGHEGIQSSLTYLVPRLVPAGAGVVILVKVCRSDYRYWRLWSAWIYFIALPLIVLAPSTSPTQEILGMALVIYLAHWCAVRGMTVGRVFTGTLPFVIVVLPAVVLSLRTTADGPAVVLVLTALAVFFVAGGICVCRQSPRSAPAWFWALPTPAG